MKLNKSYIVILLIALIAMDNIVTMNAISVERRRQYRRQKSKWFWDNWFTSDKNENNKLKANKKVFKPTKQKFFAFGKGFVIGLVLGAIYKLIGIGVDKGMGALFGEINKSTPEATPSQPQSENMAKLDDIHKIILGDTTDIKAGSWDEFIPTIGSTAVGEILGASEPEKEKPSLKAAVKKVIVMNNVVNRIKLLAAAKAQQDILYKSSKEAKTLDPANTKLVANAGTAPTAQQKQDFARIVLLAQAQMKKVPQISEQHQAVKSDASNAIMPSAVSFWDIAKEFGNNIKDLYQTKDAWKGIAWNILKQVAIGAVIVGISILNPVAGAIVAAAYAVYNLLKDVVGLVTVILNCLREDGKDENKNCGQQGIAAGMKVVSIVAGFIPVHRHRKHHRHHHHRLAKKIRRHQE